MAWIWIFGFIVIVFGIIIIVKTLVKVAPYQKWVKESWSKYKETLFSGWHFLIPFADRVILVDVREKVFNTWSHEMITKDNAVVTVDAIAYMQIIDAYKAVYDIDNPYDAVLQLVLADLRSKIWNLVLDQCLSERAFINTTVQQHLSEETAKWGIKVTRVEIQRIEPPVDLIAAMQEQKKAEQLKRAQILRAEWEKEAQIREAEWFKQKQIIEAEWFREKQILEAQWKAQAIELESNAAIKYFTWNAIIKEQLRVTEEAMKTNTKYVMDSDIFDVIKWFLKK